MICSTRSTEAFCILGDFSVMEKRRHGFFSLEQLTLSPRAFPFARQQNSWRPILIRCNSAGASSAGWTHWIKAPLQPSVGVLKAGKPSPSLFIGLVKLADGVGGHFHWTGNCETPELIVRYSNEVACGRSSACSACGTRHNMDQVV